MKWITRQRIQVNRTATCWLIQRFLDSESEFLFVPPEEVARVQAAQSAIGFDAPGATYPHKNAEGFCSFAALVYERLANDSALVEIAPIVQAADFNDQLDNHSAARGLQLISRGFPLVTSNDTETAARAAFIYDALYGALSKIKPSLEANR
jgi:hypothetical protein